MKIISKIVAGENSMQEHDYLSMNFERENNPVKVSHIRKVKR